jgi:hypothetical protein
MTIFVIKNKFRHLSNSQCHFSGYVRFKCALDRDSCYLNVLEEILADKGLRVFLFWKN